MATVKIPEAILKRLVDDKRTVEIRQQATLDTLAQAGGIVGQYRITADNELTDEPEGAAGPSESMVDAMKRRRTRGLAKPKVATVTDITGDDDGPIDEKSL